jgi:hypothetical protein
MTKKKRGIPMSKYSPGPWQVSRRAYPSSLTIVGEDSSAPSIASVWGSYGQPQYVNARLIAAAPELLEALESVMGNVRADYVSLRESTNPQDDPEVDEEIEELGQKIQRVEALIERVQGD